MASKSGRLVGGEEEMTIQERLKEIRERWEKAFKVCDCGDLIDVPQLVEALEVAVDCIYEMNPGCAHDETDDNYRPLGDTYGWCSRCQTKVDKGPTYAWRQLGRIENILCGETNKEEPE